MFTYFYCDVTALQCCVNLCCISKWGSYPEKTVTEDEADAPEFTAALLTTARTWKQPRGPATEGQIKKASRLHFHCSLSCTGEGNGTPLQCSCLENPRDGGAWRAAVYGAAQSRTRLKRLSSNSSAHDNGLLLSHEKERNWVILDSAHKWFHMIFLFLRLHSVW